MKPDPIFDPAPTACRQSDATFATDCHAAPQHTGVAVAGAAATHALLVLLLLGLAWIRPMPSTPAPILRAEAERLVWVVAGPAGGASGGGGDELPAPPRRAPVPAVRPPDQPPRAEPPVDPVEPPLEPLVGSVLDVALLEAPIALVGDSDVDSPSRGDGGDLGAGRGSDAGAGARGGDRLGSGRERGAGDDPGNAVGGPLDTLPRLLFSPTPQYTAAAMLRHVEGEVHLECIALPSGTVGDCRVLQSLDGNAYGLDDEAGRTARRFRFEPATRDGRAVATVVCIVLAFRIR